MAEVELAAAKRHAVIGEDSTKMGAGDTTDIAEKQVLCVTRRGGGGGGNKART